MDAPRLQAHVGWELQFGYCQKLRRFQPPLRKRQRCEWICTPCVWGHFVVVVDSRDLLVYYSNRNGQHNDCAHEAKQGKLHWNQYIRSYCFCENKFLHLDRFLRNQGAIVPFPWFFSGGSLRSGNHVQRDKKGWINSTAVI